MSIDQTNEYGQVISNFCGDAQSAIQKIHEEETIKFIRIRSKAHEIMIAPDTEYTLIVIQNPDRTVA
jgi:dynein light chain roadblock-type